MGNSLKFVGIHLLIDIHYLIVLIRILFLAYVFCTTQKNGELKISWWNCLIEHVLFTVQSDAKRAECSSLSFKSSFIALLFIYTFESRPVHSPVNLIMDEMNMFSEYSHLYFAISLCRIAFASVIPNA